MVSRARLSWGQRSRRPGCFASPYLIARGSPKKKCSAPSDPDNFGGNRFDDLLQRSSNDSVELELAFKV